jgi:hypothetical protein
MWSWNIDIKWNTKKKLISSHLNLADNLENFEL